MSRLVVAIILACFLGSSVAFSQTDPDKIGIRYLIAPTYAWSVGSVMRNYERTVWNGSGTWGNMRFYISSSEGKEDLGLADEQRERLSIFDDSLENVMFKWSEPRIREEGSEYANAWQAMSDLLPRNDYLLEKATPKEIESYRETYMNLAEVPNQIRDRELNRVIEETLTSEQMLHLRTIELQLSPEIGLTNPAALEPLGLSDEQKRELAAVKKEMEPEFEKYLAESSQLALEGAAKVSASLAEAFRKNPNLTNEERDAVVKAAHERNDKDENRRNQLKKHRERQKDIATRLKRKFMNVLTDEQLDKMQQLIDDAPNVVKKELEKMRRQRAAWEKTDSWRPGPGSWQPGDGVPEEFKRERQKSRFPGKV